MANRFNLDSLRDGIKKRTELSEDASPRSMEGSDVDTRKPFTFEQPDYDRTEAPKDAMRKYWRQFETTPIIRKPITSFAQRVTEPGYYIEATGLEEEDVQDLGKWLDGCGIIEGLPGKDFRLLARKSVVQREVRGTALIEKAPHKTDSDRIAGLKLINPEPMEAVTRPHQSILMEPDDIEKYDDAPKAGEDKAAAWLQDTLETDQTTFGRIAERGYTNEEGDQKIGFTRDQIIPLTRDADVGEIFGTSRLEAVSPRIEGLKQKLKDNDEAIKSKAYPLWLFLFGNEERPWDSDKINQFMSSHEMENFNPGMKQGVRGDVDVKTVSGEVAEIAEYLEFDIQWIMAAMPMPMFVLGSFGQTLAGAQFQGQAQQRIVERQIEEARRELEEEFTPVVREIAEQKGIDEETVKSIKLRFGKPSAPDPDISRSEQVIRYVSDAQGGQTRTPEDRQRARRRQKQQQLPSDQPQTGAPKKDSPEAIEPESDDSGAPPSDGEQLPPESDSSDSMSVWDAQSANTMATLQRGEIAQNSIESLSSKVSNVLVNTRDNVLRNVAREYQSNPSLATGEYERIANRKIETELNSVGVKEEARSILKDKISEISNEYGSGESRFAQSQNVSFFTQNVVNSVRDAAEQMMRRARVHIRNGASANEQWQDVEARIVEEWNTARLNERAEMVAYMSLKKAVETTKLQQFEQNNEIIGVRVSNPDASTPITESLAGAEAYFNEGESVDEQLASQADRNAMRDGFEPLPRVPPYHFNDTTTLEPIYR